MMRLNHYSRLMSYSYYIKFAWLEDVIYFHYININILEFLKMSHDENIIQDNALLNDEIMETSYMSKPTANTAVWLARSLVVLWVRYFVWGIWLYRPAKSVTWYSAKGAMSRGLISSAMA
jgi:hypothetical protein